MARLPTPDDFRAFPQRFSPFLDRLSTLFDGMDRAYADAASGYGFSCTGCHDNCCMTPFYHHTLLEYLAVMDGFLRLDDHRRQGASDRAREICRKQAADPDRRVREMCPINEKGLCGLYPHRPMICRLHGIPNELRSPRTGNVVVSPGCDAFDNRCGKAIYRPFDRTLHYRGMAQLEQEMRLAIRVPEKIKMTIAEMIVTFSRK